MLKPLYKDDKTIFNGTCSTDSFISFMKKYNIIDSLKKMINSDKNILD